MNLNTAMNVKFTQRNLLLISCYVEGDQDLFTYEIPKKEEGSGIISLGKIEFHPQCYAAPLRRPVPAVNGQSQTAAAIPSREKHATVATQHLFPVGMLHVFHQKPAYLRRF